LIEPVFGYDAWASPPNIGSTMFFRRYIPIAAALFFAAPAAAEPGSTTVAISGFLVGSILEGEGEQCVRLANLTDQPLDLAGFSLTNRFGVGLPAQVTFPAGLPETVLPPHGEIVVARDAHAYRQQFGEDPDFELRRDPVNPTNLEEVPDLEGKRWPLDTGELEGGVLALVAPDGETIVDAMVWDFEKKQDIPGLWAGLRRHERQRGLPEGSVWEGPPLELEGSLHSPYPPKTRLYLRDHDTAWRFLPDTNTGRDWDAGASTRHLGQEPTHRVMMAGQSRFRPEPRTERAVMVLGSAPDNNHQALLDAWAAAESEILVSVYYFSHPYLADALVEAVERGVDVTVWLEGTTVGVANGFSDLERHIARRIEEAGRERSGEPSHGLGRVYWLASDKDRDIADRYAFDHSKYSIIDRRGVVIGSENYGMTGHPVDPSWGNRGWEIQVHTPPGEPALGIVQDLVAVWLDDVDPEHHRDVVRYSDKAWAIDAETGRGRYGPPPPDFDAGPFREVKAGRYWSPHPTVAPTVEAEATFQLVLSPDNSLDEDSAILGAIAGAQEEILLNHLDLRQYWGSGRIKTVERGPGTTPNLLLEAVVEAARRGVRVRVLLDCSGLGCETGSYNKDFANNDDTVRYLRRLAEAERLDIQARLVDVYSSEDLEKDWQRIDDEEDLGLSKVHNKGLVIDGQTTLFSSINGSENSFVGNREVGLLVTHPAVAAHYAALFFYDWTSVAAPRQLEAQPGALPAGACQEAGREGLLLTGLQPDTLYHLRATAFDGDQTDVDRLDLVTPVSPHESALSAEVTVVADGEGVIGVAWEANQSERLEGDLAGYRLYWSPRALSAARTAADARQLGLLAEDGGAGFIETPGCGQP
jgi:cardiolipin synthase